MNLKTAVKPRRREEKQKNSKTKYLGFCIYFEKSFLRDFAVNIYEV